LLTQGDDSEIMLQEVWSKLSTSHTMHWYIVERLKESVIESKLDNIEKQ